MDEGSGLELEGMEDFTRDANTLDNLHASDYLLMDLGDSDDLDDFDLGPLSPVLQTSLSRSSQVVQSSCTQTSASQSGKPSPINMNASQTAINSSRPNLPAICSVMSMSQPPKPIAVKNAGSPTWEGGKRSIQLHSQPKNAPCNKPLGKKTITQLGGDTKLIAQKRSKNDSLSKDKAIKRLKSDHTKPVLTQSDAQSDGECDTISLYARDEDYISLYTNNHLREVSMGKPVSFSGVGEKKRNVVVTGDAPAVGHGAEKAWDLRHKISRTANAETQAMLVSNITVLLDKNSRSETLIAASKFCMAYEDKQIQKVNWDFYCVTRRLAEMLWNYNEMGYLCKIVQHAIDLRIELNDQVLCGLVAHLGRNFDHRKISLILGQLKEKSLVFGDVVFATANKFLSGRKPANFLNSTRSSKCLNSESKKVAGSNLFAPLSRSAEKDMAVSVRTELLESPSTSPDDGLLQISSQKSRGILKTATSTNFIEWRKEPLFIEIQNQTMRKAKKSCFGCVPHEKANLSELGVGFDNEPGSANHKGIPRCEAVDFKILGKRIGDLAETIGDNSVPNSLFDGFADMLISLLEKQHKRVGVVASTKESQSGESEGVDKMMTDFKALLESALESRKSCEKKESVIIWLSWIVAKTNNKLSMPSAYKIACLMENMKLNIIPPVLDRISQSEKKARFQSAEAIIRACLGQNDLDLAMRVVSEYVSKRYDPGPVLSPLLCKMLCSVAELAHEKKRYIDAGRCMGMLPAGFGDGLECGLMEKILYGIFTESGLSSKEEEIICNDMVEQMLARSMATEIRTIIVKAFCSSVVPVFKYLEGKGVYRRPQIAQCPHLIIIPYMLSLEEMALVVQRHLTELSEYLMEMGEKLCMDIPVRIILCKNAGSLQPLSPVKSTNFRVAYDVGLKRVMEMLTSLLVPKLKISSKGLQSKKQEYVINVAISSVRRWMLANTEYGEGARRVGDNLNGC